MLSEDAIENLVQPIVDRQESINSYVVRKIAKKLREIGELSPSDIEQLIRLRAFGADVRLINAEIARLTQLQIRDIQNLIRYVAEDIYIDAKPFYDYRMLSYVPFKENTQLQKVVKSIAKITADSYINLSNSKATGYFISGKTGHIRFTSVDNTYTTIIDKAIQANQSGIDYKTAISKSLKELTDSGMRRLYWDSGYTQRLDTAVRRNILDGIRDINQEVHNVTGEQFNADGKELTAHAHSAPDHEPFQGHQFTNEQWEKLQNNEDFEDIQGRKFSAVERSIGVWNCRHFAYSIIIGFSKPNYTDEQLQNMIEENHRGVKIGKREYTIYECTQLQRQLETKIRYAKEAQITYKTAGLEDEAKLADAKVRKLINEYLYLSKTSKLIPRLEKTFVQGYK